MRAIRIDRPGGYDRLRLVELPDAPVGREEIAVAVTAAGVNYADSVIRMGLYKSARDFVGWPITPGFEVAGTVQEVGADVRDFSPGDRVIALTRFGGYASRVVAPRAQVFRTPAGLTDEQAAAFSAVHLTAYYALRVLGGIRPGMRVLVHSAAGGVGTAALQLARRLGAESVGVVGAPHKVAVAERMGARHVVDKSRVDLWPNLERLAPRGFDVVLDPNGVETLWQSYRHLAPGGRLVIYGFATMLGRGRARPSTWRLLWSYFRTPRFDPLRMTNANRSVMAFNLSYMFDRHDLLAEAMAELLGWLERGELELPPVAAHRLEAAGDAQRALETGSTVGKLVLLP